MELDICFIFDFHSCCFLGNFLIMGLIYLLMAVLDLIAGYNRNGRRDLRGYISLILTLLYGVLFFDYWNC